MSQDDGIVVEEGPGNESAMEERLERMAGQLATVSGRLTSVETAVVNVSDRLTAVEAKVVSLDSKIDARFDDLGRQMRVLYEQTRDDMRALDPGFELRSEMRRADATWQRQIDDNEQRNQDAHRWFKSQLDK